MKLSELSMFISYSGLCPECSDFHQRSKFFFLVLSGAVTTIRLLVLFCYLNASVNSTCAQPPPRAICPPCQSRGWDICKCCTARGPGICQPPGQSRAFDTHAVSYQNITTKKVLLKEKQIGSFVKDTNKL